MTKKKFLLIIPAILVLISVLGLIVFNKTLAKNSYINTEGTVFIKKSELTGVYVSLSAEAEGKLAINCDVIRGVMKSPLDPSPAIRVSLTNNTAGKIEIRKSPAPGQYGIQVLAEDKNRNYIGDPFNIELDLRPKETRSIDVTLFSSLETKGFGIFIRYKK